ncbi:hypothetical protein BGX27_001145 [Mortierella sp. AM989]|nr:hypothetical protein BGX27_001145 [Mortierella sp. AM989]
MSTGTSPVIRARNAKYQANVTKRGHVKTQSEKKVTKKAPSSPFLVGFLLIVLCGGAIFEVIRLFGAKPKEATEGQPYYNILSIGLQDATVQEQETAARAKGYQTPNKKTNDNWTTRKA